MSLCEGRECGDEQLKTWGLAQTAAGSQCVAVYIHTVHRTCCAATDETVSNTEEGDTAPTVARTGPGADC